MKGSPLLCTLPAGRPAWTRQRETIYGSQRRLGVQVAFGRGWPGVAVFNVRHSMAATFQSRWWQVAVPSPWKAEECEECVEITQPEGIGALHLSSARKSEGSVSDTEALSQLQENCLEGTETERVRCGDFAGYVADYVDWNEGAYWKNGFLPVERSSCLLPTTASEARRNWRAHTPRHCCRRFGAENEKAERGRCRHQPPRGAVDHL